MLLLIMANGFVWLAWLAIYHQLWLLAKCLPVRLLLLLLLVSLLWQQQQQQLGEFQFVSDAAPLRLAELETFIFFRGGGQMRQQNKTLLYPISVCLLESDHIAGGAAAAAAAATTTSDDETTTNSWTSKYLIKLLCPTQMDG